MILPAIIIILGVAIDVATKYAAVAFLVPGEAVTVIPGVVEFTYLENRGAAFGMLAGHPWVFNVFSVAAIAAILVFLFVKRPPDKVLRVSLAMIAAGGIGNMIERIAHGYVTDFINPPFVDFAVFNAADSFVTVGCAILVIWLVTDSVREAKNAKNKISDNDDTNDIR